MNKRFGAYGASLPTKSKSLSPSLPSSEGGQVVGPGSAGSKDYDPEVVQQALDTVITVSAGVPYYTSTRPQAALARFRYDGTRASKQADPDSYINYSQAMNAWRLLRQTSDRKPVNLLRRDYLAFPPGDVGVEDQMAYAEMLQAWTNKYISIFQQNGIEVPAYLHQVWDPTIGGNLADAAEIIFDYYTGGGQPDGDPTTWERPKNSGVGYALTAGVIGLALLAALT